MSFQYETTKRDFVRVATDIPVRYKFLSKTVQVDQEGIFQGVTNSISGTGLLLIGKLPGFSWIPGLLTHEIVLGVNIMLPALDHPVKALAQVAWIERIQKGSDKCPMGIKFHEITKEHQDVLLKFVIKSQITH